MPFTPKDWQNADTADGGGDESTPLGAADLEDMEIRVTDYTDDEVEAATTEISQVTTQAIAAVSGDLADLRADLTNLSSLVTAGYRTNEVPNPSYETDLTGVTATSNDVPGVTLTRETTWSASGTYCAQLVGTASTADDAAWLGARLTNTTIPAVPHDRFVLSVTAMVDGPATSGPGAFVRIEWRDDTDTFISVTNSPANLGSGEQLLQVTAVAPPGTASVMPWIYNYTETDGDVLDIRWDAVMLERLDFDFNTLDREPAYSDFYTNFATKANAGPIFDGNVIVVADTGQEILASGQDAHIESGKMFFEPTGPGYGQPEALSDNIHQIGARLTFSPYTTHAATVGIIIWAYSIWDGPFPPDTGMHLIVGPETFLWGYFEDTLWYPLYGGGYDEPLAADNTTIHEFWALTSGDTLLFRMPDGNHHFIIHPKIEEFAGPWATFEGVGQEALGYPQPEFTEIWADTKELTLPTIYRDYFDGDSMLAEWTGTAHASTSIVPSGISDRLEALIVLMLGP